MKFAIQVHCAPWASTGGESAVRFIRAALRLGHEAPRVFFYHDGVCQASAWAEPVEGARRLVDDWRALAIEHGVDLVLCVSAAQRRGLWVSGELAKGVLAEGFRIGGLGLWLEACLEADRLLVFA